MAAASDSPTQNNIDKIRSLLRPDQPPSNHMHRRYQNEEIFKLMIKEDRNYEKYLINRLGQGILSLYQRKVILDKVPRPDKARQKKLLNKILLILFLKRIRTLNSNEQTRNKLYRALWSSISRDCMSLYKGQSPTHEPDNIWWVIDNEYINFGSYILFLQNRQPNLLYTDKYKFRMTKAGFLIMLEHMAINYDRIREQNYEEQEDTVQRTSKKLKRNPDDVLVLQEGEDESGRQVKVVTTYGEQQKRMYDNAMRERMEQADFQDYIGRPKRGGKSKKRKSRKSRSSLFLKKRTKKRRRSKTRRGYVGSYPKRRTKRKKRKKRKN